MIQRRLPLFPFLAAMLAAALFALAGPVRSETVVTDATGAEISVGDISSVVSVGGAVTEILFALGLGERIVAVDTTSLYPHEVMKLPNVGYMRRLAAEPIIAMSPSLLLAVEDSGPPVVLDQLREAGVTTVVVPDDYTAEGVVDKIRLISQAMGVAERGQALARRIERELEDLKEAVAAVGSRPRVLFLLSMSSGGAPLAAGHKTSANGIIELAGGVNAVDGFEGYKALSPEALVQAAPDVVLVTSRTLEQLGGSEALSRSPEVSQTPAGRDGRIVAMDGLLLLGFGPRTPLAIDQLAGHLHPGFGAAPKTQ